MPFAYLNIDNPLCAWAVYRGKLVLPPNEPGFISIWMTGLYRSGDVARYNREVALEIVRASKYPHCISRLRCIFGFESKDLADRALKWGESERTHFQPEYLAELIVESPSTVGQHFDANWISHSNKLGASHPEWMELYWAGESFPGAHPHWESLYSGTLIVCDSDIRQRAHQELKSHFPESVSLIEFARLAACIGSDFGMASAFLRRDGNKKILDYIMNFVDEDNPQFHEKLRAYLDSGYPVNWQDIHPNLAWNDYGRTPDMRLYRMEWDLSNSAELQLR